MDQLKYVRQALRGKKRAEVGRIAVLSGVPYHTVIKIVTAVTDDPRYSTVHRLFEYLEKARAGA